MSAFTGLSQDIDQEQISDEHKDRAVCIFLLLYVELLLKGDDLVATDAFRNEEGEPHKFVANRSRGRD